MTSQIMFNELLEYPLRSGVTVAAANRGSGIKMLNMGELFKFPRIPNVEMARVDLEGFDDARTLLRRHDLMFARRSLTLEGAGKCSIVEEILEPTTWESSIIRARIDPTIGDARFYFYYFNSPIGRRQMEMIVEQVAAAGIRLTELGKLFLPFPSLDSQCAMAEVLGALDDKTAANAKVATSIIALLELETQSKWLDAGSDATIAISELFQLNPATARPSESEPVYVDMKKLPESGNGIMDWQHREAKGGARFQNGDTLLARITPCLENRKTGYVDFLNDGQVGIGSTEFIVLRSRTGVPRPLSYFIGVNSDFRDFAIRHMVGTSGRQRVSASDLAGYFVPSPDSDWLADFGERATNAFELMKSLRDENRTLTTTRDALLPQLMSGKLRVKDAEKVLEGVL